MISLSDGMVGNPMTEEHLCEHLNTDRFGYRPMTREEIVNILGKQGARFP